jgi:hypothetical protein
LIRRRVVAAFTRPSYSERDTAEYSIDPPRSIVFEPARGAAVSADAARDGFAIRLTGGDHGLYSREDRFPLLERHTDVSELTEAVGPRDFDDFLLRTGLPVDDFPNCDLPLHAAHRI